MISTKQYAAMSREELAAEIRAVQSIVGTEGSLLDLVQELRVHQEEIRAQQAQLLEAQRALEESRDRYADLYDFAPIGFVTLDRAGVIQEANLAAALLLGAERARLVGFPLLVHVADRERRAFLDHLSRCRNTAETVQTTVHLRSKVGTEFLVNLVSRPAIRADSAPCWHTGIVDLTAHERAEQERHAVEAEHTRLVREEEALRSAAATKDRFLAVLSHELRTPLTPILFTLGALEARGAIPEELQEPMKMVRRYIELEARLIDDLLDTTRITTGKLHMEDECVDVHALLQNLVEGTSAEIQASGLCVHLALQATEHHVRGDSLRLRQVFWNVLSNAIRHTPPGGSITLGSRNERGCLQVSVTDTGSGIEPQLLGRIFEAFEQAGGATRSGLGLGLAISKGIIEAHHGRISAQGDGPGRGTRIDVELDTIENVGTSSGTTPVEVEENGQHILLVEDHHDSAVSLSEVLRLYGHDVTVAESFTEACAHRGEDYDLLITDIGLPDGDGIDLLRELGPPAPRQSICLSGYGSERDVARSRDAGFDRHLTKPVDVDALLRVIDDLSKREKSGVGRPQPWPQSSHPHSTG